MISDPKQTLIMKKLILTVFLFYPPIVYGGFWYPETIISCGNEGDVSFYRTNEPWVDSNLIKIFPWIGHQIFLRQHGQWTEWCELDGNRGDLFYGDRYVSCVFDVTKGNKSPKTNKYHSLIFEIDLLTKQYRSLEKSSDDGQNYQVDEVFQTDPCKIVEDKNL